MSRTGLRHGDVAALPLAAGATLLIVRALPVHFTFHPNTLGIVSVATLRKYPLQQETFYFAAACAIGFGLALVFRYLLDRAWPFAIGLAAEIASVAGVLGLLFLPSPASTVVFIAGGVVVAVLAARAGEATEPPLPSAPVPQLGSKRTAIVWLGFFVLSWLLMGAVSQDFVRMAAHVPDAKLTSAEWQFMAEEGQHLYWATGVTHGMLHGKDFFSLYGPYYDLGVFPFWWLFGRSVAGWQFYMALLNVAGMFATFVLGATLLRRKWLALGLMFIGGITYFRYGAGCLGLALLFRWVLGGRREWALAAGVMTGFTLFFSQEYGLALAVAAIVVLAVRTEKIPALLFAGGAALPMLPIVVWFAARGALAPMVYDLMHYPGWVMAGYGKLPFPALNLPLTLSTLGLDRSGARVLMMQAGFFVPPITVAALALVFPWRLIQLRRPRESALSVLATFRAEPLRLAIAATVVYGLLAFRTGLGRSDTSHLTSVVGVPCILLLLGAERAIDAALQGEEAALAGAWRLAALGIAAWIGGLFVQSNPLPNIRQNFAAMGAALHGEREFGAQGDEVVNAISSFVHDHSSAEDRVYFVPGDAALYYLAERRDPTRWSLSSQMVTDAHREEALAALVAHPPRWVVFDAGAMRVDNIPDGLVFGPKIIDFLRTGYEPEAKFGKMTLLRPRGTAAILGTAGTASLVHDVKNP